MTIRKYNKEIDKSQIETITNEVGWDVKAMDIYVSEGRNLVAELNGKVEAFCSTSLGDIQYLENKIPFSELGTVAVSFLARKQKISGRMTALKIAEDAGAGAAVCGLGMFDQGYYDKMGFGTGNYTHWITFPLKALKVKGTPKIPTRLGFNDFEKINRSMQNRMRWHGSFSCTPDLIKGGMSEGGMGLGYFNEKGELTHHIWFEEDNLSKGPLSIAWWSYQNYDQLMELLVLLKSLSDQIISVSTIELPFLNIQDLIERPFHNAALSKNSPHQYKVSTQAFWQMRILDLEKCLSSTELPFGELCFNLELTDPIESFLKDEDCLWRGIGGNYTIMLGEKSSAKKGFINGLPTLKASVGAFTRMWLGCEKASNLTFTDELKGDRELISSLDKIFSLPLPKPDHPF